MTQAHIYMVNTIFAVGAIACFLFLTGTCLWLSNWIRDLWIGKRRAAVAIKLLRDHYRKHGHDAPYKPTDLQG